MDASLVKELRAEIARLETRLAAVEDAASPGLAALLLRPLASRRLGALLLVAALAVSAASYAAVISVPHTFVNGTVADADEVNANFAALVTESNSQDARIGGVEAGLLDLNASNLTSGTVPSGRLSGVYAININGTAASASQVDWSSITNMPAGFADGVDDDTLRDLSCSVGQVAKFNGASWACAGALVAAATPIGEAFRPASAAPTAQERDVYEGVVLLGDRGDATVAIPTLRPKGRRALRYQLTAMGAPAPSLYVSEEVRAGRFRIAGGVPGTRVSWQVTVVPGEENWSIARW
jgi:hypothetical protein